jgi:hypothetical protein
MYSLYLRLIVVAALLDLGWTAKNLNECPSRQCLVQLQKASQQVLKIHWKPISVFPEEAKRFR